MSDMWDAVARPKVAALGASLTRVGGQDDALAYIETTYGGARVGKSYPDDVIEAGAAAVMGLDQFEEEGGFDSPREAWESLIAQVGYPTAISYLLAGQTAGDRSYRFSRRVTALNWNHASDRYWGTTPRDFGNGCFATIVADGDQFTLTVLLADGGEYAADSVISTSTHPTLDAAQAAGEAASRSNPRTASKTADGSFDRTASGDPDLNGQAIAQPTGQWEDADLVDESMWTQAAVIDPNYVHNAGLHLALPGDTNAKPSGAAPQVPTLGLDDSAMFEPDEVKDFTGPEGAAAGGKSAQRTASRHTAMDQSAYDNVVNQLMGKSVVIRGGFDDGIEGTVVDHRWRAENSFGGGVGSYPVFTVRTLGGDNIGGIAYNNLEPKTGSRTAAQITDSTRSFTLAPGEENWIGNFTDDALGEMEQFWLSPEGQGAQPYMPGYADGTLQLIRDEKARRTGSRRTAYDMQQVERAGNGGWDTLEGAQQAARDDVAAGRPPRRGMMAFPGTYLDAYDEASGRPYGSALQQLRSTASGRLTGFRCPDCGSTDNIRDAVEFLGSTYEGDLYCKDCGATFPPMMSASASRTAGITVRNFSPTGVIVYNGGIIIGTVVKDGDSYRSATAADGSPVGEFPTMKDAVESLTNRTTGSRTAADAQGDWLLRVRNTDRSLAEIQAYLWSNMSAAQIEDGTIFIQGHDVAGFTRDAIRDRLFSGMIGTDIVEPDPDQGVKWASRTAAAPPTGRSDYSPAKGPRDGRRPLQHDPSAYSNEDILAEIKMLRRTNDKYGEHTLRTMMIVQLNNELRSRGFQGYASKTRGEQ